MKSTFSSARAVSLQQRDTTRVAQGAAAAQGSTVRTGAAPTAPALPRQLLDWLTQLTLLYGVPFEYLVADPRLLPPESMRFFHIDRNWLQRSVDGALSTATLSTAEAIFNETLFEAVYAEIEANQQALRATLRGKPLPQEVTVPAAYTGFLFRSVVVSGWPGLEVLASREGKTVELVRMDRLSATILLVIFAEQPDSVSFIEPSEGLHFGLLPVAGTPGAWQVNLRGLGLGGYVAGTQIAQNSENLTGPVIMRDGTGQPAGVVRVADTAAKLAAAMPKAALPPSGKLSAAGFALQMVRGAGRQDYTASATALCPANGGQ
ncbi:hypothetical protein [Paracoccus lutimaris]|uniref:Uncharacterized protein n=1 Tax=Paracoccus lutimaris TaxID=1490030 RepID=A0A368YV98_9RHOB|nr:hypothetical protein [Paracoccus lutimaris]RCW84093.1 hypothetical protein DFP89_10837 [Paracoccus lutimaris]